MADTRNVRLTLAYDGTDFHGFAESDGVRTVLGELRRAVETIVRRPVDLVGAGRTDAGVHAWGQVVSGLIPVDTDLRRLTRSVNAMCAPALSIRGAQWVDTGVLRPILGDGAHVSVCGLERSVATSTARTFVVARPAAARPRCHEHRSSRSPRRARLLVVLSATETGRGHDRTEPRAHGCRWPGGQRAQDATWGPGLLQFEISATSFCHQMVRSIVGTLVDVGRGRRAVDSIPATLAALDRNAAGPVAPPTGLVLFAVDYSGERWDS